jgi:hypothetical protein
MIVNLKAAHPSALYRVFCLSATVALHNVWGSPMTRRDSTADTGGAVSSAGVDWGNFTGCRDVGLFRPLNSLSAGISLIRTRGAAPAVIVLGIYFILFSPRIFWFSYGHGFTDCSLSDCVGGVETTTTGGRTGDPISFGGY